MVHRRIVCLLVGMGVIILSLQFAVLHDHLNDRVTNTVSPGSKHPGLPRPCRDTRPGRFVR